MIVKLANNVQFRVFVRPEDDYEEIKSSFLELAGYSEEEMKKEKIKFFEKKAKGFGEKTIKILEIILEKDRHCNKFLKKLPELMSKNDKDLLLEQTNRLDDNLNFFLRLDKDKLVDGDYLLTDSGNCFHITISVSAFPKKKTVAFEVIKQIFQ